MRLLISFIYWEVRYINAIHFLFSSPAITFVGGEGLISMGYFTVNAFPFIQKFYSFFFPVNFSFFY